MINNETTNTPFSTIRCEGVICLFLIIATLAVYWQVGNHEFVDFDDNGYVTENRHVQSGLTPDSVIWAFTSTHACNWHPLTWLSHMLDCQIYGLSPGGHHFTNVILHILNSILLFLIFRRMTGALWKSAFIAALFALHPLHVESVAWVAERKDVLSTFFWMLTMGVYVFYTERPGIKIYLITVLLFALGLMAKPMLVTLPFVLLLLDYWPLGRFKFRQQESTVSNSTKKFSNSNLVWEKTPFFVLAAVSSIVTFFVQQGGGAVRSFDVLPLFIRVSNALVSYISYIGNMFWPYHLAVLYPHNSVLAGWKIAGACLLLVFVSFMAVRTMKQFPYILVGWLWYLGTLVPVIGLVQVGSQAMADRYTYIPLIGLFVMIAWGVPDFLERWQYRRTILAISAGCILSVLTMVTWMQLQYWQNSISLFEHTLNVTTDNFVMHNNMGLALQEQGKTDEAIAHYTEALLIQPNYVDVHNNLGIVLVKQGKVDEAIGHYAKALRIKPDYSEAHYNLGIALQKQGKINRAIAHFNRAIKIQPDYAKAHNNLGNILAMQDRMDEAIDHYISALKIKPDYSEAHYNLGNALVTQGRMDEAIGHYSEALRINPGDEDTGANLQVLLKVLKETDKDIKRLKELLENNPGDPELHYALGNQYYRRRDFDKSIYQYQKALSIQPDAVPVLNNLAIVYMAKRDYEKAVSVFGRIADLQPDNASVYYNIACIYSIQNRTKESLDSLKRAVEKGYDNWDHVKTDKDLKNIRSSLYYKEIMGNH